MPPSWCISRKLQSETDGTWATPSKMGHGHQLRHHYHATLTHLFNSNIDHFWWSTAFLYATKSNTFTDKELLCIWWVLDNKNNVLFTPTGFFFFCKGDIACRISVHRLPPIPKIARKMRQDSKARVRDWRRYYTLAGIPHTTCSVAVSFHKLNCLTSKMTDDKYQHRF